MNYNGMPVNVFDENVLIFRKTSEHSAKAIVRVRGKMHFVELYSRAGGAEFPVNSVEIHYNYRIENNHEVQDRWEQKLARFTDHTDVLSFINERLGIVCAYLRIVN